MSRRRRGRRGSGATSTTATNSEPPVELPETVDDGGFSQEAVVNEQLVQQQYQQPQQQTVYPSQLIAHCHELSAELMNLVVRVEMLRDMAAGFPMAPAELPERLDGWADALTTSHKHAGGILSICTRLQEMERGQ